MKRTYEVRDRADKRAIREFLKREGQFLLPMLERNLSTTMGHSTGLIKEQFPVWRGVWWED